MTHSIIHVDSHRIYNKHACTCCTVPHRRVFISVIKSNAAFSLSDRLLTEDLSLHFSSCLKHTKSIQDPFWLYIIKEEGPHNKIADHRRNATFLRVAFKMLFPFIMVQEFDFTSGMFEICLHLCSLS